MVYDYTIQYWSSKTNMVVDALSKVHDNSTGSFFILSMSHFTFLAELKKELSTNFDFLALQEAIQANPTTHFDYFLPMT